MPRTFLKATSAAALLVAGTLISTSSAMAACGPGYKPVKWQNSGNTVCVLIAGYPTNQLTAKPGRPKPFVGVAKRRMKAFRSHRARRRHR